MKAVKESADAGLAARIQALRSAGSTRLGAVLRHAGRRLIALASLRATMAIRCEYATSAFIADEY